MYLCISDTYRTFPIIPFIPPPSPPPLPTWCPGSVAAYPHLRCLSASSPSVRFQPLWHAVKAEDVSQLCRGDWNRETGKSEEQTKGRRRRKGKRKGGGGKVNIISFLTPWDRKQPPHTVKVQKVKALNQLLQLMWMSARVSLHERNTNTSGRGSAPTYLADY